jgi:hypothetical protein
MAEKMTIDGGCHCGAIAYEATIDPETVGICHCTDCQTLTSSAFRIVAFVSPARASGMNCRRVTSSGAARRSPG